MLVIEVIKRSPVSGKVMHKIERYFNDHKTGVNYYKAMSPDYEVNVGIYKDMVEYQKYMFDETIKKYNGTFSLITNREFEDDKKTIEIK